MNHKLFFVGLIVLRSWVLTSAADASAAPVIQEKQGAEMLKTDIMGVFAHPDDETGAGATLAYYALGRHSIVANVYCTRGEGGGNMVGTQSGAALGALREAELRDCLGTLGVRYCYFLDQLDWAYTESLAATLQKWGKEPTLERLVRLVRLLRPEVIITMNPAPSPGQHGHHQAAGVLATEAFSAAADPKRFPLQLSKEGLEVWQVRKLFFAGGESSNCVSVAISQPLGNEATPGQVAGRAMAHHRSQAFGNPGDAPWLARPQKFTLVKTCVPGSDIDTDLLAGLPAGSIGPPVVLAPQIPQPSVEMEFVPRPALAHYRQWMNERGIGALAMRFRGDLPVISGQSNPLHLRIANHQSAPLEGELRVTGPNGWTIQPHLRRVLVPAGANAELLFTIGVPPDVHEEAEVKAELKPGSGTVTAAMQLHPLPRAGVTRLANPPPMDGSDAGWQEVPTLKIEPTDLVQGKVAGPADSSAVFRLAHDGKTLFADVLVRDDVIVTNIAPNDIKGHWRSDSIELCFDPIGGAEHTMNCYKLGIFPFDTSGVVRGARDADANQGPIEETSPKTRLVSRRTADGYRIQAAIPFEELRIRAGQKQLGFNLIIYDGDKADAALGENINKSRIAWSPRAGVQGRPEDWGRVDLE